MQNINAVSVDDSVILELTSAVTDMTETLDALVETTAEHACKIKHMRAVEQDQDEKNFFREDSSAGEGISNRNNPILVRGTFKAAKSCFKRRKTEQYDGNPPALRMQVP